MTITEQKFSEILEKSKLTHESETSFGYRFETQNLILDFYKNDDGVNIIEEFCQKVKGVWIELNYTKNQFELIQKKLKSTPFMETEKEIFEDRGDLYDYYGVNRADFY